MVMSIRERLLRTFKCLETDRMPVRLTGVNPFSPKEGWDVLYELTEKYQLDIIRYWMPSKDEIPEAPYKIETEESVSGNRDMAVITTMIDTPLGHLTQVSNRPFNGAPGYITKYFIEEKSDALKYLSLPVQNKLPGTGTYFEVEKETGDRAMLMVILEHSMYAVHKMMGSEIFGYWLYDERALLKEMIDREYSRIEKVLKHYISKGAGYAFGWHGPELCIPPLASVKDFREFVASYDSRLISLIHDHGALLWAHCHGDMAPVLGDFMDMGVDCLNPIEPPPVSKITLGEAKEICKGKMALEGALEDGAFDTLSPGEMEKLVEEVISQGKPGGGFILCPTSSPALRTTLLPRHINNYRVFAETASRLRNY